MARTASYRLVKTHRSYDVHEAASLLGVHRNTVRQWLRSGLAACDDRRPTLILGRALADFLQKRQKARRRPCPPGHLYCLRCRAARFPAEGMADYVPTSLTLGNIVGLCPTCGTLMYRRVNPAQLSSVRGDLDVRVTRGTQHIDDGSPLSVNSDFAVGAAK